MYHADCGEIPQEVTDKVYDYFFPEGAYSITGTDTTKAKIDETILELHQEMQNALFLPVFIILVVHGNMAWIMEYLSIPAAKKNSHKCILELPIVCTG